MTGQTVFITTGATVTFKALIELSLSREVLSCLKSLGFTKLLIQYGQQKDGLETFLESIAQYTIPSNIESPNINAKRLFGELEIEGIPFTNDIKAVMSDASLVVSHAGTGSILDALRLNKKLVVVINDQLMNNHQAEIADEFERDGYLLKSNADTKQLIENLIKINEIELKKLPEPNTGPIRDILLCV